VRSEGPLVAATGVEDVVIVATQDAVLVTNRDGDANLKELVDTLDVLGRREASSSPSHRHIWGTTSHLMTHDSGTVDRFDLVPGAAVDLGSGTWVVVSGEGTTGESTVAAGDVIEVPPERAVAVRNERDEVLVAVVIRSSKA
jgi:mannose-6-phosphate isomerase-like protein (cupin superfamily)